MLNIALKNIKEKTFRSLLASLSIAIGTASMILFLGLSQGIQNATFEQIEKSSPLTQITVHPNVENSGFISFLTRSDEGKLDQEALKSISKIDGVKKVYPEIQFNNFASLEVDLLGLSLVTDTMAFGLPYEFVKNDIKDKDAQKKWETRSEPYPVLVPRKVLDLYNLTVASPQNLPTLSEETLLGKDITFYPNYSTFFPIAENRDQKVELEVAGFSDKVNLIGITLPYEVVQNLNTKYTNKNSDKYLELFVETVGPGKTPEVAKKIEELGYSTQYFQKNLKDIEAKFTYLQISLGIISAIILLTAAIAIVSTFLATVAERTKEIGLFRALGATKNHIKKIILIEAGIIGFTGSIIGIILGILSSLLLDKIGLKQLEQTTFSPETLFQIDTQLIFLTLVFGTVLSLLSAYIPAKKAANINPIEALNRS